MRAEGLLPKVSHLTYFRSSFNSETRTYFMENVSAPLAMWNGLKTVYIYGDGAKAQAAIFHGISQLSPPPLIEMDVGEMRMLEFEALFRLRKGKLQPGTALRLITKRPVEEHCIRGYLNQNGDAESYWAGVDEEAAQVADKHGVRVEISAMPRYKRISA
jgi:hypothetical protein